MFESLDAFATAVEASDFARSLKFSRLGYAVANTSHVLGIALLVGAILPLDLRLMGFFRSVDRTAAARLLVPVAALGLTIAILAGMTLFTVRAEDYVQSSLFFWKLGLIAAGAGMAIWLHARTGLWIERASDRRAALHGAASLACWLGALVLGRFIAYFPG